MASTNPTHLAPEEREVTQCFPEPPEGGLRHGCKSLPLELYLCSGSCTTTSRAEAQPLQHLKGFCLPLRPALHPLRAERPQRMHRHHVPFPRHQNKEADHKQASKSKQSIMPEFSLLAKPPGRIQLNCKVSWAFGYLSNNRP